MIKLLRLDEVAKQIGKSPRTVRRLIRDGELIAHRPRPSGPGLRVLSTSVDNYVNRHEIHPDVWKE